ncbi:TPA: tail fiber assembly protein [Escherichia coli]|nr:tail fiber assembly protein [Escherichia coli]
MYKYSAKNNAFYLAGNEAVYRDSGTWPDDATEIETQLAESFMVTPPQGKRRIAGADGMPDWGDIPPPTQEEVIASVSAKKQALISEANNLIAPPERCV